MLRFSLVFLSLFPRGTFPPAKPTHHRAAPTTASTPAPCAPPTSPSRLGIRHWPLLFLLDTRLRIPQASFASSVSHILPLCFFFPTGRHFIPMPFFFFNYFFPLSLGFYPAALPRHITVSSHPGCYTAQTGMRRTGYNSASATTHPVMPACLSCPVPSCSLTTWSYFRR